MPQTKKPQTQKRRKRAHQKCEKCLEEGRKLGIKEEIERRKPANYNHHIESYRKGYSEGNVKGREIQKRYNDGVAIVSIVITVIVMLFFWWVLADITESCKVRNGYLTHDGKRYQVTLYDELDIPDKPTQE